MSPSSPDYWPNLRLVKRLKSVNDSLCGRLNLIYEQLEPLMKTRPLGAEQYTDHDLGHSARVASRIDQILPDHKKLNPSELYVLLAAVLLHDSGMWGTREEVSKLQSDEAFLRWATRHEPERWKKIQEILRNKNLEWMGTMAMQNLAADYFRANHPRRLGDFVLQPNSPAGQSLRLLVGEEFLDPITSVALSHSWDRIKVLEDKALQPRELGGHPTNLRFLAALLRLGDLLDLGQGRISTLLWDYLRPLNPVSESHWRKEHTLRILNCSPNEISVGGNFDINNGGLPTADAFRFACDWLDWIKQEITDCLQLVPIRVPNEYKTRCTMGELKFDATQVGASGLVIHEAVALKLDEDRIIELLSDEIYSSPSVFVRELLQNAVDATRAQMIRDLQSQKPDDPTKFPMDRPWDWPVATTGLPHYQITVNIVEESDDRGQKFLRFEVIDQGTGMTLEQIQNNFLQVGVSYYRSQKFRDEFELLPISRFGIGFLSCLAVTTGGRIEVTTRCKDSPEALTLTVQKPSRHYLISKTQHHRGTTVKLWIKLDADNPPGWDRPPLNNGQILNAAGIPMQNLNQQMPGVNRPQQAYSSIHGLAQAVSQWVPFPEMTIKINGASWGPRAAIAASGEVQLVAQGSRFSSVTHNLNFFSPRGRSIGQGSFTKQAFRSGLPTSIAGTHYSSQSDVVRYAVYHSHRGIFIDSKGQQEERAFLLWNSVRLPPRSLSAARVIRGQTTPAAKALFRWLGSWVAYLYKELERASPELCYIWHYLIRGTITPSLPPPKFPYRTGDNVAWKTVDELRTQNRPALVVPFGVAWKGVNAPIPSLPMVGGVSGVQQLWDLNSQLVTLPDICTAAVWPSNSGFHGLTPFSKGVTHFGVQSDALGIPLSPATNHASRVSALTKFPSGTFRQEELQDYDRKQNLWKTQSLSLSHLGSTTGFVENELGKEIHELLNQFPRIHLPVELLRVEVADGDEWV